MSRCGRATPDRPQASTRDHDEPALPAGHRDSTARRRATSDLGGRADGRRRRARGRAGAARARRAATTCAALMPGDAARGAVRQGHRARRRGRLLSEVARRDAARASPSPCFPGRASPPTSRAACRPPSRLRRATRHLAGSAGARSFRPPPSAAIRPTDLIGRRGRRRAEERARHRRRRRRRRRASAPAPRPP